MLDFAAKLTVDPGSMERGDVEELRRVGLSDQQILSVALITCLFNFMTRLADGWAWRRRRDARRPSHAGSRPRSGAGLADAVQGVARCRLWTSSPTSLRGHLLGSRHTERSRPGHSGAGER